MNRSRNKPTQVHIADLFFFIKAKTTIFYVAIEVNIYFGFWLFKVMFMTVPFQKSYLLIILSTSRVIYSPPTWNKSLFSSARQVINSTFSLKCKYIYSFIKVADAYTNVSTNCVSQLRYYITCLLNIDELVRYGWC